MTCLNYAVGSDILIRCSIRSIVNSLLQHTQLRIATGSRPKLSIVETRSMSVSL